MDTTETIAARLERVFAARGFAEPGVALLREQAGTTLRTLYRHFPSREAMILGALEARHRRYHAFLDEGAPAGEAGIPHLFERLAAWMAGEASTGCLFVQALAAHPESVAVARALTRHKAETRALIARRCAAAGRTDPALPDALFLLHEGQATASVSQGAEAARDAALAAARALLAAEPKETKP